MTVVGCLKIEIRTDDCEPRRAKKKPAVIYDGRLFFSTQRLPAADTPLNAYQTLVKGRGAYAAA
jgi:hypothetical protein